MPVRLREEFGIEYPPLCTRVLEIINDVRRQEGWRTRAERGSLGCRCLRVGFGCSDPI